MYNQNSWFIGLIAAGALCLTTQVAQSAHAAPDFPSEKTVQELARAFVYSQATLDPEEHKRLEAIYYFDSQEDRTRYENGAFNTIPVPLGGPRFLGPDGIPLPPGADPIRPEDILVVPPPANLSDDAEPMAIVFYPDWNTNNYRGPAMLRFVHSDRGWLIRFETYKPTSKESFEGGGDLYMALQAEGQRVERARWANATGDDLLKLVRRQWDRNRYQYASAEYALAHDVRVGSRKGGSPHMTDEKLRRVTQLFEQGLKMTPDEFKTHALQALDERLASYEENKRKSDQSREYVRELDEKRRQP